MKSWIVRTSRVVLGILCLGLGALGGLLPIMPGFVFGIIGLVLISYEWKWLALKIKHYSDTHPKVKKVLIKLRLYRDI